MLELPRLAAVIRFEDSVSIRWNLSSSHKTRIRVEKVRPVDDRAVWTGGLKRPACASVGCSSQGTIGSHETRCLIDELDVVPGAAPDEFWHLLPGCTSISRFEDICRVATVEPYLWVPE